MRKRYGKFYARWTGADGKRHEKACDTAHAAEKYQREQKLEVLEKKVHALRLSPLSSARGRRRKRT
jgi:hypothetical protein